MNLIDKDKLIERAENIIESGSPLTAPMLMVLIRNADVVMNDDENHE